MLRIERDVARPGASAPPVREWRLPDGTPWAEFFRAGDEHRIRFPEYGDFFVSADGRAVRCVPAPDCSRQTLEHLFQNQVLPLALSVRGALVFHASAVDLEGEAVAFAGPSGRGKSTLAASFATSGAPFLTDDALVLESRDGRCVVLPTQPSVRLWSDSQDAVLGPDAPTAPAVAYTSKSRFLADSALAHCDRPRPLRRVYFLEETDFPEPVFHAMKPAEALIALVSHSFLLDLQARERLSQQFDEIARIVPAPRFFRLAYRRSYEDLARVREAIKAHARIGGPEPRKD